MKVGRVRTIAMSVISVDVSAKPGILILKVLNEVCSRRRHSIFFIIIIFRKNKTAFSWKSSVRQMIHMKCQALFFLFFFLINAKTIKVSSVVLL